MSMGKRRTLHPDLWRNEGWLTLPVPVRLTAIGLHMFADDQGRGSATPSMIRAALWPMDPEIADGTIDDHLLQLDAAGLIVLYSIDSRRTAYALAEWCKQNNPAESRLPPPPEGTTTEYVPDTYSIPVGEREGERASARASAESEDQSVPASGSVPPSPFCRAHPDGIDAPCRNCGTARLRNRRFVDLQMAATNPSTEP